MSLFQKNRREFLKIGGLSALSLPVLGRFGRVAFAAGSDAPKRFIALYSPNGTVPDQWKVTGTGSNFTFSRILKPLEPFKSQLLIINNLGYSGYNTPHSMGTMKALTARDVFDARPANTERGIMTGPSLDTELASALGAATFRDVLRMSVSNRTGSNRAWFNFTMDGTYIKPVENPQTAFEYLFPGAQVGAPMPGAPAPGPDTSGLLAKARLSVVDLVRKDAQRIHSALPSEQRPKMEAVLEVLAAHEKSIMGAVGSGGNGQTPGMPAVPPPSCQAPVGPGDPGDIPQRTRAMMDNIVAAFACDVTRFATLMLAPGADGTSYTNFIPSDQVVGSNRNYHDASHEWEKPDEQENLTRVNVYFSEQVAYLLGRLKSIQDADGNDLLHNTAVLWTNECWHGNHQPAPIPLVVAGSAGGYLKNGIAIEVDQADDRAYGKLLATLANAVGHTIDRFGDHMGDLPAIKA